MSSRVLPFGSVEVTVPASGKLAANSKSAAQIYQKIVNPNQPDTFTLFKNLAADEDYSSAAVTPITVFRIDAGPDTVFYNVGTDAVVIERRSYQGNPGTVPALNTTGALTAAMILSGMLTSTTGAAVAGTVPTGTVMDAAVQMNIGDAIDWSVINTGGANAFTVTAASGHTLVGNAVVALSSTGRFRTVKTAAATFVTYRLS
jgi:hypothetical protein